MKNNALKLVKCPEFFNMTSGMKIASGLMLWIVEIEIILNLETAMLLNWFVRMNSSLAAFLLQLKYMFF
jgi:hypothetical protein